MRRFTQKRVSDGLRKISIIYLNQHGLLLNSVNTTLMWENTFSGNTGSLTLLSYPFEPDPYIRLLYNQKTTRGRTERFDHKISLTTTPCYFGGKRYWFRCNLTVTGLYCGRRVGVLYDGGNYFGCRYCYNLTYSVRNQSHGLRVLTQKLNSYKRISDSIMRLKKEIRLRYYDGYPTKKQLQLESLYSKINQ